MALGTLKDESDAEAGAICFSNDGMPGSAALRACDGEMVEIGVVGRVVGAEGAPA